MKQQKKDVLDDITEMDINEIEEEIKEDSKLLKFLKKAYVLLIVFFLILLLVVNTNIGYHLVSIASGKIASSTLEDNSFSLKYGGQVFFNGSVIKALQSLYDANQKHEFKACLLGRKEGKDYFVTGFYIPVIYDQDVFSVTSQMCNSETIISLHSHPPLSCLFSEKDTESYNKFKTVNKEGIIALMCAKDRMSFFGY